MLIQLRRREAGALFARADVDLVVCYFGAYATSSQVVPAVRDVGRPVLVLNLQPTPALDYARTDTAEWLANCCVCRVPELAGAFTRCGIPFNVVSGLLREQDGPAGASAWREIDDWVAAGVARALRGGRLGFLGHTYPGMMDLYSDFTMISGQTGLLAEILEIDDLHVRVDWATGDEVRDHLEIARASFTISAESPSDPLARAPHPDDLEWAARVSAGMDALRRDFALDASPTTTAGWVAMRRNGSGPA